MTERNDKIKEDCGITRERNTGKIEKEKNQKPLADRENVANIAICAKLMHRHATDILDDIYSGTCDPRQQRYFVLISIAVRYHACAYIKFICFFGNFLSL